MNSWSMRDPKPGDIIRVEMGHNMHHYGIYVSDEEVIQFGLSKDAFGPKENVRVLSTGIQEFLNHKFLEVREYTLKEKLRKNKPEKVVSLARGRIGEKGYDILENNCEHFVNECVFNKHESEEVKNYRGNL